MEKEITLVLFEALVVGVGLVVIYEVIKMLMKVKEPSNYTLLFISGVVFHLLFEYTGINKWYSIKYCDLLK